MKKRILLSTSMIILMLFNMTVNVQTGQAQTLFAQESQYSTGGYDLNAAQPTGYNWTRQSKYNGPSQYQLLWSLNVGLTTNCSPAIAADGTIYFSTGENKLYAVNPDGTLKWTYYVGAGNIPEMRSPVIGKDGTIYVCSFDNNLYAISDIEENGEHKPKLKWSFSTQSMVNYSPVIGEDGTVYVTSCFDKNLYAINPDDGKPRWTYAAKPMIDSMGREVDGIDTAPVISKDGTIYFGGIDKRLYAVKSDGTLKWSYVVGRDFFRTTAIGADGTIYAATSESNQSIIYAITDNGDHGTQKWVTDVLPGNHFESDMAIAKDGTIYAATYSNLCAINSGGELKWSFPISKDMTLYPAPIIGADGTIYAGIGGLLTSSYPPKYSGHLYAISPSGTIKWISDDIGQPFSAPAIGKDGTIYIGTIYAMPTSHHKGDFRILAINVSHIVSFDSMGGSAVASVKATPDSFITIPAEPIKSGYVFKGWYKDPNCTNDWNFSTDTVTGDTTLYAKWAPDSPPVLNDIEAVNGKEGSPISFTVTGSDPDGDTLTYSVSDLPEGAAFDPVNRTFTWTPSFDQAGTYKVKFEVSDKSLSATKEAAITVENVKCSNANLNGLTISSGTLSPAFSNSVTSYTASVGNNVTSITVTPTAEESHAEVKVNGITVASGSQSGTISLNVGNNPIEVEVTAEDGITKKYIIGVNRAGSQNNGGNSQGSSPSTPGTGGSIPAGKTSTVTGSVIEGNTGTRVSNIEASIVTDGKGNSTVAMNAFEATSLKEPGGNKIRLSDISKVSIITKTGTNAAISPDGTIKIANLANGTDNNFSITYDLGNGQRIAIGTINVSIDSKGNASVVITLIDPYGIITDEATGKPIEGAQVTLYYANTDRNKAAGKVLDTIVCLPGIDGFKPNNNKNPQLSDKTGAYGFMVFPNSDYYIIAEKDGYIKYKSPIIPVGVEIVKWNFNMHPSGAERLSGQGRVDTAINIANAVFPNTVSNVILATGDNYPDALAGSMLAYKLNAPILLVGSSTAEKEKVLSYLKENMDPTGSVYILGGGGAVNSDMEAKITSMGFKNIHRVSGKDRYDTSARIAEAAEVKEGTPIIIVSGEDYPDALSISSVAAVKKYPILLTCKDGISDSVWKEISKINPGKVYIIGLQGVISNAVEDQIAKATLIDKTNIVRIGGLDRYATSVEVAKYFDLPGNIVCTATGNNFPDTLAGSIYAAINNAPIILVDKGLSDDEITYLKDMKISGVTILGGEGAVSKDIEDQMHQIFSRK